MINKNSVKEDDLNYICYGSNVDLKKFEGKTIIVTGATGIIGSEIIFSLLFFKEYIKKLKIFALVRNIEKAKKI